MRGITSRTFADHCAPTMVRRAADGIVQFGAPDRDQRLVRLLEAAMVVCRGRE